MKLITTKQTLQAIVLGILAGMRTSAAPVAVTHILSRKKSRHISNSPLNFMQSPTLATVLKITAVSELVVDKLPSTPNRIEPAGVAGRGLSGALAGAAIFKAAGGNVWQGAFAGGITAVASTYASYWLRKNFVKSSGIADPVIGGIEDVITIGAGIALCNNA
ncbi:DUF4126 family protein [Mucilaginibacter celer]|uniref:DUF4126 family protein n=1 Tax=Mucilaginibacter celer TaxID=2305508 RepID=A0A494VP64_9SPHI|nr:DUF4126 family protein [Mucilaginibacter celer]AYL95601.1 DUF4126 family protein [Mucilaginibacter celer]